jgi:hypothetical protein
LPQNDEGGERKEKKTNRETIRNGKYKETQVREAPKLKPETTRNFNFSGTFCKDTEKYGKINSFVCGRGWERREAKEHKKGKELCAI